MDILNTINTVKVSGSSGSSVKKISEKSKWQLTDSLKEKIVELAKKDAKNNVYMGNEFMNLRKAEVTKVAPNRAALIGKFNQSMSSENMGDMKEIQEADKRWMCILFGIPYESPPACGARPSWPQAHQSSDAAGDPVRQAWPARPFRPVWGQGSPGHPGGLPWRAAARASGRVRHAGRGSGVPGCAACRIVRQACRENKEK